MPAFDPVRDAVLNSPVSRIQLELPISAAQSSDSRPGTATNPSMPTPTTPATPDTAQPAISPLTRRATDLSVLLNSDAPGALDTPLFTPTTPRAAPSLSNLLLPTNEPNGDSADSEQLAHFAPLRRRSIAEQPDRDASYFSYPGGSVRRASTSSSADLPRGVPHLSLPGALPTPTPTSSESQPSSSPVEPAVTSRQSTATPSAPTPGASAPSPASASTAPPPPPETSHRLPPRPSASSMPPPPPRTSTPPSHARMRSPSTSRAPAVHPLPPKPAAPPPPPADWNISRSKVPYAPTRRLTPAGSVLVPLSPAEMERYRNYPGGAGTLILRKKRRREGEGILGSNSDPKRERDEDDEARGAKKRRVGDVGIVVDHYNARPEVGVTQRQESPIIGLKSFNNWVKSVLITRFAHPVLAASPTSGARSGGGGKGKVLDMGCGKGGDLTKWAKARVKEYVGLDIASVSIDQAQQRHAQLRGHRFTAAFLALDCYSHSLSSALPPAMLVPSFDAVSMQFCMHYAFESEEKARCMLENVSTWLREGGVFIGTIPNADQLLDRLDALPPDASELSFGNSVYKIRFENRRERSTYGQRYWFYLQDAVDDVPEYIVHWDNFIKLAAEYRLHITYKKEFHELFEEHHEHSEFGPLLERMRVVDANGESQMDEDQWEAANIYIAFAMEKR